MKNLICRVVPVILFCILAIPESVLAQTDGYRSPGQVASWVNRIVQSHPGKVQSTIIATTPGKRPVHLIEIGNQTGAVEKSHPSIFVVANFEGVMPLATEGALFLTEMILSDPANYDSLNWYIIPVGNPDAAARFFDKPLYEDSRNDLPTNDDRDDQTDEDGVNDLNNDGWITQMRVKHPEGTWIISETDSRLMQQADPKKGEQGIYKLYTEGIDDDGDGKYNEDGPGGTSVDLNFPFLFKYFTANGGLYPGSTPESFAVMKFVFEHPDISMIFSFGSTNFCLVPPKGGRKGEPDLNNIRVPANIAGQIGLDPARPYSMNELITILKAAMPEENIDESVIAGFLGLGAVLNPQAADLVFYNKYVKDYKAFLKEKGVKTERFDPAPASEGSLELWSYFHVGVPVFSMDLWGFTKPAKDTAQAKTATTVKPGAQPAAAQSTTPSSEDDKAREVATLAFSDSLLNKQGFVDWEPFDHPTLGNVEIGGFVPFIATTPPYSMVDSLLSLHVPWILKLADELPDLRIYGIKTTSRGSGVYQLEVWIENHSFIPFPTAMGKRNRQPAPAVLTIEGDELVFMSGYRRTPIRSVDGKSRIKLQWVLQTEQPREVILKLESKSAGWDQKSIKIGG